MPQTTTRSPKAPVPAAALRPQHEARPCLVRTSRIRKTRAQCKAVDPCPSHTNRDNNQTSHSPENILSAEPTTSNSILLCPDLLVSLVTLSFALQRSNGAGAPDPVDPTANGLPVITPRFPHPDRSPARRKAIA
ncbi:hypothetical protein DL546_004867 [Coniochaeta pulveracea]|uniref:Uncharacterized protein n=1 Tax=Coniochaeta pulveracea TaxID=177199 RepID=A0A420Y8M2_9PEZI|nr:hypothetical protein DL546_004867 [Coniochaeta pulveracea]